MTSISPTSMIRTHAFAIGLSNYSQPVMPTRTIALPAVSETLAQVPARPAARCASAGGGATTEKHRLLVRVRRRSPYENFDGGLPVSATIEMGTTPVGMVPLLQVHDELLLEVPEGELAEAVGLVVREMRNAVELSVPLEVEVKMGRSWGKMRRLGDAPVE